MGRLLHRGTTGRDVSELQSALNFHIRSPAIPLKPDGIFGPLTDARLREFQAAAGIKVDGVAGPVTISALYRALRGTVEAIVTPRKPESAQLFSRSRPPAAGSQRSPLFGVPVLGQPGPAIPNLGPPGWRIPQSRYAVSPGFEVETKFLFSPLSDPQEGDHPVRLTITPKLPWPIFQPDLLKLDIESSTTGVGKFQLDGKLKLPFQLTKPGRVELEPYFFVGAGVDQDNFKELNAGGAANLKLKLLPNIGGSGVSVGLETDGGIKYNHDLETREGKLKGVFESLVVVEGTF